MIDFFFINDIDGKKYICCKSPYTNESNIESDKDNYPYCKTSTTETYLYEDNGVELINFLGGVYSFPKKIEKYLSDFYGKNWRTPLDKKSCYKYCYDRAKILKTKGKCYYNDKYA